MALKSWDEMRKIDVSEYLDTRESKDGDLDYLNWAKCIVLLHQNGAKHVYFEPLTNPNDGSSLWKSEREFEDKNGVKNCCYEVAVKITIDDDEFVMRGPVMNLSNPVKDNSMSQQRVWNAQTRTFVKGVAIRTGLGFDLWSGDFELDDGAEDLSRHNIFAVKQRLQEEYTQALKKGKGKLSTADLAQKLDMTEDEVKMVFTYFDLIDRFEKKLIAI